MQSGKSDNHLLFRENKRVVRFANRLESTESSDGTIYFNLKPDGSRV